MVAMSRAQYSWSRAKIDGPEIKKPTVLEPTCTTGPDLESSRIKWKAGCRSRYGLLTTRRTGRTLLVNRVDGWMIPYAAIDYGYRVHKTTTRARRTSRYQYFLSQQVTVI